MEKERKERLEGPEVSQKVGNSKNAVEKIPEISYNDNRIHEAIFEKNENGNRIPEAIPANQNQRKSYLSNVLDVAGHKARYDAEVKKILSDKTILAWILKFTVREFEDSGIEEIRDSIEGEPEVSTVPVYPGMRRENITGLATEDKVPNEGEVTYDIRFYAITPGGSRIKLLINVEAQKEYYPGYDLVTRAIFYCARMLSAQMDTEFTGQDYDGVKKVYSIWICMDAPAYAANTITEYHLQESPKYGAFRGKVRYDLLSAVMVCLGREGSRQKEKGKRNRKQDGGSQEGTKLHQLLSTLLSETLTPKEKTKVLAEDFDIAATVEIKEDMRNMCNLSDLIEERGIKKGMEQGIEQGAKALLEAYKELGLSRKEALWRMEEKLSLSREAAEAYMKLYWK